MDVSIILVTYNTLSMTTECIKSILEFTKDVSFEIILVDNASHDGSKDYFEKCPKIKYIYNNNNQGFGVANNIAMKYAHGRNVLFLNTDTLLNNNAVKILSDFLDGHPQAGGCGGNLYDANGLPSYSFCKWFPSIKEQLDCLTHRVISRILFLGNFCFNKTKRIMEVAYVTGADLMVKREVLDECGFFDPRFFLYFEETELCYRIRRGGYKLFSVPEAEITHFGGSTVKRVNIQNREYYSESRNRFFELTGRSGIYSKVVDFLAKFC